MTIERTDGQNIDTIKYHLHVLVDLPSAVSPDSSIFFDFECIQAFGATARVVVEPQPSVLFAGGQSALRGWKQLLGLLQELEGGGSGPVGDGAWHCWVDALPHCDFEPEVVAFPSYKHTMLEFKT